MKALLLRLRLAWCVLTARRAVVYLPRLKSADTFRSGRIGELRPDDWDTLAQLGEACYLAQLAHEAVAEAVRVAAIEAEIRAVLGER